MSGGGRAVVAFRRFLAEPGRLDIPALERLCGPDEARGPVGNCHPCGGYVFLDCPVQSYRSGGPVWVQLVCTKCGHETACPDGRLVPARRVTGAA